MEKLPYLTGSMISVVTSRAEPSAPKPGDAERDLLGLFSLRSISDSAYLNRVGRLANRHPGGRPHPHGKLSRNLARTIKRGDFVERMRELANKPRSDAPLAEPRDISAQQVAEYKRSIVYRLQVA